MLNTDKYKQNKTTRKERITLRDLIKNPHIVINKADKGSTIVAEDRNKCIANATLHLNDPTLYKPLDKDVSPTLKESIINSGY